MFFSVRVSFLSAVAFRLFLLLQQEGRVLRLLLLLLLQEGRVLRLLLLLLLQEGRVLRLLLLLLLQEGRSVSSSPTAVATGRHWHR